MRSYLMLWCIIAAFTAAACGSTTQNRRRPEIDAVPSNLELASICSMFTSQPVCSEGASGQVRAYLPTEDTYVRSDYPSRSFADAALLHAVPGQRVSYYKFVVPVEEAQNIGSARIFFYAQYNANSDILEQTANNWSEETINWTNQPQSAGLRITTPAVRGGNYFTVDVTEMARSNPELSVRFVGTGSLTTTAREHGRYRPQLELTVDAGETTPGEPTDPVAAAAAKNLLPTPTPSLPPSGSVVSPTDCVLVSKRADGVHVFRSRLGGSLVNHYGSGDHSGFSADGRFILFLDSAGGEGGSWYAYERESGKCYFLTDRNVTKNGSTNVNMETMWAPQGSTFWRLESNTLVHTRVTGQVLNSTPLPSTIAGPAAIGGQVNIQWRSGTCSTEQTQFINGFLFVGNETYYYVQSFNALSGALGSGFWVHDATGGRATRFHNGFCGHDGLIFSPAGYWQQLQTHVNWDGSDWRQVEPGTPASATTPPSGNEWTHPTWDGNIVIAPNPQTSIFKVIDYTNFNAPRDLCTINMAQVKEAVGAGGSWVGWHHGDLRNGVALFSTIDINEQKTGIALLDVNSCSLSRVVSSDSSYYPLSGDFYSSARPAISSDASIGCWHGGSPAAVYCKDL